MNRPCRDELEDLCRTMSNADLARHYGRDKGTVRAWLRYYGLEAKSGYGGVLWRSAMRRRINQEQTAQEMVELARKWK